VPGDFGELKVALPEMRRRDPRELQKIPVPEMRFRLWKIVAGRQLEIPEVEELITKRVVGPLQGFRSKMGRPFAAIIKLNAGVQAGI
jgi:DNA topoisomerase III